jgi:serine/threonine-protein kinase RsbW
MGKKRFTAKLDDLHAMLGFIRENGLVYHVPSSVLHIIAVAIEEVLVNIINYGYPKNKEGSIDIHVELFHEGSKKGIKIDIFDYGIPFNPVERLQIEPPPDVQTLLEPSMETLVGGYGIYIFTKIMDKVEYQRLDQINKLSLIKYL